ncbi:MAG TPA: saccharopine dehydrogenase C-terminal domain-containing protein [Puia sp.]|nr:saccharopine dehydrogenase C-terminal domain-containing protein [Puia sp.]
MKKILLFGAGKSATSLIRYLLNVTAARGWQLLVAESNWPLAQSKIGGAPQARAVAIDVRSVPERDALIAAADIVISLLPPSLHYQVALSCVKESKSLLTASYLDDSMRALEPEIRAKGLLFLCEMGLDPGIDHMSALQLIRQIRSQGGEIDSFYSHTGGLVAPASDDNPWHYKISWNPRNVVLAGSAGASYREDGRVKTRSYQEIFDQPGDIHLPGLGTLAWYPNRDSLSYIPLYGLPDAHTFIRTTLRYPAFCAGWKNIVRAGLTDATKPLGATAEAHAPADHRADAHAPRPGDPGAAGSLTYAQWSAPLLPFVDETNRAQYAFLGLFDPTPIAASATVSADILQHLLETRLAMRPTDRDMIVMVHEIGYRREGKARQARSVLRIEGEDSVHTAMARTVGLPLGIAAVLVLEGKLRLTGVHIPILPAIYDPVMHEMEQQGIRFEHTGTPA